MKKIVCLTITVICLLVTEVCFAQSAGEFDSVSPPASGGKTKPDESNIIEVSTDVKEKTALVIAKTMQDGAAKAAEIMTDSNVETIITTVTLTSGKKARLATGSAPLLDPDKLKNEDQKREAIRYAVMRAYIDAQTQLVKALSDKAVVESTINALTKEETKIAEKTNKNAVRTLKEKLGEEFDGNCRPRIWGCEEKDNAVYVTVYQVDDDSEAISINAGNDIYNVCLNAQYKKITSGRLLPEGGEIYRNTKDGEFCYIGYANAVIFHSDDKEDQTEFELDAKKEAIMRAQAALLGIMYGKGCKHIAGRGNAAKHNKGDLSSITGGDEQDDSSPGFNTSKETSTVTDIAVNGTLPPGVEIQAHKIKSGNYYYAFAMYKTKKPVDPINAKIIK
jgi:hypothetical protein